MVSNLKIGDAFSKNPGDKLPYYKVIALTLLPNSEYRMCTMELQQDDGVHKKGMTWQQPESSQLKYYMELYLGNYMNHKTHLPPWW